MIDPAAETELSLLLKQCGFALVDAKSLAKPEIEISGEAFSERGLQKGALIGCSVAVDLAERIAAKTALQSAARQTADRVIPAAAN